MSYCCSTCRNLDRSGALDNIYALATTYGWEGLASQLHQLADKDAVRDAVRKADEKREAWMADRERKREEEIERKKRKAQERRTRQMFKPPSAENIVYGPPYPLPFE